MVYHTKRAGTGFVLLPGIKNAIAKLLKTYLHRPVRILNFWPLGGVKNIKHRNIHLGVSWHVITVSITASYFTSLRILYIINLCTTWDAVYIFCIMEIRVYWRLDKNKIFWVGTCSGWELNKTWTFLKKMNKSKQQI